MAFYLWGAVWAGYGTVVLGGVGYLLKNRFKRVARGLMGLSLGCLGLWLIALYQTRASHLETMHVVQTFHQRQFEQYQHYSDHLSGPDKALAQKMNQALEECILQTPKAVWTRSIPKSQRLQGLGATSSQVAKTYQHVEEKCTQVVLENTLVRDEGPSEYDQAIRIWNTEGVRVSDDCLQVLQRQRQYNRDLRTRLMASYLSASLHF